MIFYMVYTVDSSVIACELTKADAIGRAKMNEPGSYVVRLETTDPRDTIRRLLGDLGGYAVSQQSIYTFKGNSRNGKTQND